MKLHVLDGEWICWMDVEMEWMRCWSPRWGVLGNLRGFIKSLREIQKCKSLKIVQENCIKFQKTLYSFKYFPEFLNLQNRMKNLATNFSSEMKFVKHKINFKWLQISYFCTMNLFINFHDTQVENHWQKPVKKTQWIAKIVHKFLNFTFHNSFNPNNKSLLQL